MENSTRFDLNESISQWRKDLAESPAFRPDDMEELESHLRDSVANLEAKGLSPHEAFWVAKNRVGKIDSLDCEFGKVNVNEVWLNRVLWMVAGSLLIGTLSSIASLVNVLATASLYKIASFVDVLATAGLYNLANLAGMHRLLGPTSLIVYLLTLGGLYFWVWRQGTRRDGLFWRLGQWMKTRPVATVVVGVFLVTVLMSAGSIGNMLLIKAMGTSTFATVAVWQWPAHLLSLFFWPIVLGCLLARRTKKTAN